MSTDDDRLWRWWETTAGFLRWYARGDLEGMNYSLQEITRLAGSMALTVRLRAKNNRVD